MQLNFHLILVRYSLKMKTKLFIPDEHLEFSTAERCYILELLNESDDRTQSIARARVEPGVTTAWHSLHGTSECYYILSGEGLAEIGETEKYEMKPHSLLRIPPHIPQRITNTGKEDLVFLCFCTPAFSAEIYEDLE